MTLGPKPPIPDPTASDLVISEFIGDDRTALNMCYITNHALVDWIINTRKAIEAKPKK